MRLSPFRTHSPKDFEHFLTCEVNRDNSKTKFLKHNPKRSLKKITLKLFNQSPSRKSKAKERFTNKEWHSGLNSFMSTPSREFTVLRNMENNSKSTSKIIPQSKHKDRAEANDRVITIKVHYGELVLKHTFPQNTLVSDIHTHFFKQMIALQKSKWSRVLSFIGFQGLKFHSYVDYWINKPQQTIGMVAQLSGGSLQLRPVFAIRPPRPVNISDFEIYRCIGVGGFSKVYVGKCNFTGEMCALKFISKDYILRNKKQRLLYNEREVLGSLHHRSLVGLHFAFETKNFVVFVLQYCPNNQLYQYLTQKSHLTEPQARPLFKQILQGVHHLHKHHIIYRDIKLQNILIDAYGNLKISDFGLARPRTEQTDLTYTYCGSPEYMAPQMLMKNGHSYGVDYYALGVLLYEMLVGRSPFYAETKEEIYRLALNSEVVFPKNISLSKQVRALIRGLLHKNPNHRIGTIYGVKQILIHPWLRKTQEPPHPNPFFGKRFRQYLQAREPDNSYIEQEIGADDFKPHFKDFYYQNPKFEQQSRMRYSMLEKMALKEVAKKNGGKLKQTRHMTTTNTSAN